MGRYLLLFIVAFIAATMVSEAKSDTLSVPDMQCGSCEARISKALTSIDGVATVAADASSKTVIIAYDEAKTNRLKLEQAIAAVGYTAGDQPADRGAQARLPMCCKPHADSSGGSCDD